MAKFYLESADVRFIVCAADVEGAALWAMHRVMDRMIDAYEAAKAEWYDADFDDELENHPLSGNAALGIPEAIPYDAMLEGLVQFDETIRISEIGFGRCEAAELRTEEIFHKWRQLMLAVDRLHRKDE